MLVAKQFKTVTAIAGTASATFRVFKGQLANLVTSPNTQSTSYNFSIVDDDDFVIYSTTGVTGDNQEKPIIPVQGVITVTVSDSDNLTETFTICIYVYEDF